MTGTLKKAVALVASVGLVAAVLLWLFLVASRNEPHARRVVAHVQFARRAVTLTVWFSSNRDRQLADNVLASARRFSPPGPSPPRSLSDGILVVSLPRGWFGSVGPGTNVIGGRPYTVSWMLAANYSISSDAASFEGTPDVPSGKILISLGDFVVTSRERHWPHVRQLQLPG